MLKKESFIKQFFFNFWVPWVLLIVVSSIFIIILYPTMVTPRHSYELGDIADRDIKAPVSFFIQDTEAGKVQQREAVDKVLIVYDHDVTLASKLAESVTRAFAMVAEIMEAGESVLESDGAGNLARDRVRQIKGEFEKNLDFAVSIKDYNLLERERFSQDIANYIIRILTEILDNGVVANKELLLKEAGKGIALRAIHNNTEKIVTSLKHFYGIEQAKTMVRIVGQPVLENAKYNLRSLIVDFVQKLIHPNLTINQRETEARKKKAAAEIMPILYKIKAGEMLVREGERITEVQYLKLRTLEEQTKRGRVSASSIGGAFILMCLMLSTYILHMHDKSDFLRNHDKNLLFVSIVLVLFLFWSMISISFAKSLTQNASFFLSAESMYFGIPIASGSMILCLFMGIDIALSLSLVLAAGTAIIFENRFDLFIYFLLNSSMAAYWTRNCRERIVFIKAGTKLVMLNVLLVTILNVYMGDFSGKGLLWDWALAFLGGIGAGIVAAGIVPIVEMIFGYTTDIKLLELANLDRPILRRLMMEAPGTYHHSVIVGSMVEAAASEIGANSLLAKVCGYYHDIGKINKPLYFIENQSDGRNRHTKLAPSMSKRILIAHVKDGVKIAKEHRLGQSIIDTIKQSHGTSLITFFYEKAKQQKGEDSVKIEDFRYPGPKPQTREAGLVMLADVVEAASRTVENPTPARVQGLVQNLINKIFSDGQLDNCELTLKDLNSIAKSYIKILNAIYHSRVDYPEKPVRSDGKGTNGNSDRQQAKQIRNTSENDRKDSSGHLKRLGQA
jgi:putative nucleotidyltransferase with HDIG domain